MNLTLTDSQCEILLSLAESMRMPEGLNREEKIELAFDALLESYDSQVSVEDGQQMEVGQPIDAEGLRAAMKEVLNPNISTTFIPPTGDSKPKVQKQLSLDDLLLIDPQNPILKDAKNSADVVYATAVITTFTAVNPEQWSDKMKMTELVDRAHKFMHERTKRGGDT